MSCRVFSDGVLPRRGISVPGTEQDRIKCQSCRCKLRDRERAASFCSHCIIFFLPHEVPGIHWAFWPQQQKTSYVPAYFTRPHFFRFWRTALTAEATRKEEELRGRRRYWGYLLPTTCPIQIQIPVSSSLPSIGSSTRKWNHLRFGGPNLTRALPMNLCLG